MNSIDSFIQQTHERLNSEPGLNPPSQKLDSIDMRELSPDAPRCTNDGDRCPWRSSMRPDHRCILQAGHAKLGFLYCQFSPDDLGAESVALPAGPATLPAMETSAGPDLSDNRPMERLLIRVRQDGPELFLADVKRHWADAPEKFGSKYPRDHFDWMSYRFLNSIQECFFRNLTDSCDRERADGEPCGQMEGMHSHDGFCPTWDWYDGRKKFHRAPSEMETYLHGASCPNELYSGC